MPFSEVKAHLSELAGRVELQHDRILVTRNGRPSFVLLSPDDLESLEESLDILEDDDLMDSIRRSGLRSTRRGDYRIIYEVFEDDRVVLIHRVQHRQEVHRPR